MLNIEYIFCLFFVKICYFTDLYKSWKKHCINKNFYEILVYILKWFKYEINCDNNNCECLQKSMTCIKFKEKIDLMSIKVEIIIKEV
jgi:hypothetical protein